MACMNASTNMGLQLGEVGNDFIGNHPTKGCYAIAGIAFFGNGGVDIDQRTSLVKPYYRPNGYDCDTILFHRTVVFV